MATKVEKLKSWTNFMNNLRDSRDCDPEDENYNHELRCEINDGELVEDGKPFEFIVIDDCIEFHLFELKIQAEQFIFGEIECGGSVESVWYMDKEVEYKQKVVIETGGL
jgi:hypothetical protein